MAIPSSLRHFRLFSLKQSSPLSVSLLCQLFGQLKAALHGSHKGPNPWIVSDSLCNLLHIRYWCQWPGFPAHLLPSALQGWFHHLAVLPPVLRRTEFSPQRVATPSTLRATKNSLLPNWLPPPFLHPGHLCFPSSLCHGHPVFACLLPLLRNSQLENSAIGSVCLQGAPQQNVAAWKGRLWHIIANSWNWV